MRLRNWILATLVIAVAIWGCSSWSEAHDTTGIPAELQLVLSDLQSSMEKGRLDSDDCFANQANLANLLTIWQPLQPPSSTTMELNAWVNATVLNAQLLAQCGVWQESE